MTDIEKLCALDSEQRKAEVIQAFGLVVSACHAISDDLALAVKLREIVACDAEAGKERTERLRELLMQRGALE